MKASQVYSLDKQMTITSPYNTTLLKEVDMGRFGVFVVKSSRFNMFKGKVETSYSIESYELHADGYCELLDGQYFKTKKETLAAFKTYVIPENKVKAV